MLQEPAGDAEVFGAAAGLQVRAVVGWIAPMAARIVSRCLASDQGEEVVEVGDLVADGAFGRGRWRWRNPAA